MADRKEGAGQRSTRVPNRASLRAKLLAHFTENSGAMLTRQEIMLRFGVSEGTVNSAAHLLKRDGYITRLMGPGGTVSYKAATLPDPKPIKPKRTKPARAWSHNSAYIEPGPVVNSIFNLAEVL